MTVLTVTMHDIFAVEICITLTLTLTLSFRIRQMRCKYANRKKTASGRSYLIGRATFNPSVTIYEIFAVEGVMTSTIGQRKIHICEMNIREWFAIWSRAIPRQGQCESRTSGACAFFFHNKWLTECLVLNMKAKITECNVEMAPFDGENRPM